MAEASAQTETQRLKRELERTQQRLQETVAYYRAQIDAEKRRAEDDLTRAQAAEAGRRRRAEESVTELTQQLEDARVEADNSKRRHSELLARLEEVEREGMAEVHAEQSRVEQSTRAAWRSAEEEVERLDGVTSELRHELEHEREQQRELERAYVGLEQSRVQEDQQHRRNLGRLKRALKLSEQRRTALEEQIDGLQDRLVAVEAAQNEEPREAETPKRGLSRWRERRANSHVEIDPAAGWGKVEVAGTDELAEEFRAARGDRSFAKGEQTAGDDEYWARAEADAATEHEVGDISDQEADELVMQVDVDRKLAQREAESEAREPELRAMPEEAAPTPSQPWWRRWLPRLLDGRG